MTARTPAQAFIIVNGRDISGDSYNLEEAQEHILEETHGLGDSYEESKPVGIIRTTLAAAGGLYDERVGGIVEALQGQNGTAQLVLYGVAGNVQGQDAVLLNGVFAAKWSRIMERSGITKANAEYVISGSYYRGLITHPLSTEATVSGNNQGSSVNFANTALGPLNPPRLITAVSVASPGVVTSPNHGLVSADIITVAGTNTTPSINGLRTVAVLDANTFTVGVNTSAVTSGVGTFTRVTSQNAVADLHVTALVLGGYTNVVVTPLHSTDNISFVAMGSAFTARTGVGAERILAAGTIRQYMAVSWAYGGAGSGQSVQFIVAVSR